MDEREQRLLMAMVYMVHQCLVERDPGVVDSVALGAYERAIRVLAQYDLMEVIFEGRTFGRWTEAANRLWAARARDTEHGH